MLASDIVEELRKRFPTDAFLEALDVVDPRQWKTSRNHDFVEGMFSIFHAMTRKNGNLQHHFFANVQYWKDSFAI